jgi:hypothetical protein
LFFVIFFCVLRLGLQFVKILMGFYVIRNCLVFLIDIGHASFFFFVSIGLS